MMKPQIRDQFISLCNLVCEESYDGVLRQSAALLCRFFEARDSALLLLDSSGENYVVTLGARQGDAHWAPPKLTLNIEQDRLKGGVLSQVALTGKTIDVSSKAPGYNVDFLVEALGFNFGSAMLLPLFRPDRKPLGVALISGAKYDRNKFNDPYELNLVANALGGVIFQKLTEVRRLHERQDLRKSLSYIGKDRDELRDKVLGALQEKLPGKSRAIQKLHQKLLKLANFEGNISIIGPEGSMKERIAQELHRASNWRRSPFVYVNCEDLNEDNFSLLLFGHKRGAIQGVTSARKGYLREAGEGMIYFDRVDLLAPKLQRPLLRLLEKRSYRPLGAERDVPTNARMIFSAPIGFYVGCAEADFIPTLFVKMTQSVIQVPSLAERLQDIPDITQAYLTRLSHAERKACTVNEETLLFLQQDNTVGDLRALESKLERAFLKLEDGETEIFPHHLSETEPTERAKNSHASMPEKIANYECSLLVAALKEHDFDRTQTAKYLKIPKRTLADKCKKYQI